MLAVLLRSGGRPDITNGILQYITDQDDGYGIDIDPYFFNGNIASEFGLPDRDLANVDPDSELAAAPVPSSRWVDVSGGTAQGAPTYDRTNWIGCDTFANFDLGCNGAWLKEMEDKSAAAEHSNGYTFGVEIAGSERRIYVPGTHDRLHP